MNKNKLLRTGWLLCLMGTMTTQVFAQQAAVKTDLFHDAFGSPNLAVEVGLAPHWTAQLSGEYNNWEMWKEQLWKHWTVQPEVRYWFCDRFAGHFVDVHLLGGEFNVGNLQHKMPFFTGELRDMDRYRFQGSFWGGGLGYGYDFILSRHWNLEAVIGLGYIHSEFEKFECKGCKKKIADDLDNNYVGPTEAAVNLIYLF